MPYTETQKFYYYLRTRKPLFKMFLILAEWSCQHLVGTDHWKKGQWLPDSQRSAAYTGNVSVHIIYTLDSYRISGWEEFIAPTAFDGCFLRKSHLRTWVVYLSSPIQIPLKMSQTFMNHKCTLHPPFFSIKISPSSAQFFYFLWL